MTAKGSSTANVSASTRKASPTQKRPGTKYPNPNHQPISAAMISGRVYRRAAPPSDAAPSISHTSAGSVIQSTGQAKNGAMARTDTAPAANAAARLRHPRKFRTRSARALVGASAGMGS